MAEKDQVNPEHYKLYQKEAIEMIVDIYGKEKAALWCEITAFKYRLRLGYKDNIDQELKKEKWYLDKAEELREK